MGNVTDSPTNVADDPYFDVPLSKYTLAAPLGTSQRRLKREVSECTEEAKEQARYQAARFAYVAEADVDLLMTTRMVEDVCSLAARHAACVLSDSRVHAGGLVTMDDMEICQTETRLRRMLLHRQNSVPNVDTILSMSCGGERFPDFCVVRSLSCCSCPFSPSLKPSSMADALVQIIKANGANLFFPRWRIVVANQSQLTTPSDSAISDKPGAETGEDARVWWPRRLWAALGVGSG